MSKCGKLRSQNAIQSQTQDKSAQIFFAVLVVWLSSDRVLSTLHQAIAPHHLAK
ncbi:hypothetical protein [Nostoc sp.]|uniref:hypothetical protein n=1 Tax=Nostoc sp. TaxID=1180 RepID=UPI003FA5899C